MTHLEYGPCKVELTFVDGYWQISGECPVCKQFPCRHSGADFVKMKKKAIDKTVREFERKFEHV